jgi:hypothetical protein
MGKFIELTGKRFGRWTVVAIHPQRRRWRHRTLHILWRCKCDCGAERLVLRGNLRRGISTSCGCLRREKLIERLTKHGMSRTRIYKIWAAMLQRSFNSRNRRYRDYGGRLINPCDVDWRTFKNFFTDMGEAPDGMSLDRIDNNKGYSPQNCRWASRAVQRTNQRQSWRPRRKRKTKTTRIVVPAAHFYEDPPFP